MKTLLILRGRFRLFFGFCPQCNSDAPEKDNCKICDNFYGCARKEQKTKWWAKYTGALAKKVL
jgi:hypothetical protein